MGFEVEVSLLPVLLNEIVRGPANIQPYQNADVLYVFQGVIKPVEAADAKIPNEDIEVADLSERSLEALIE
jgi:hypothetical protein